MNLWEVAVWYACVCASELGVESWCKWYGLLWILESLYSELKTGDFRVLEGVRDVFYGVQVSRTESTGTYKSRERSQA